jgi:hypothetical protein
VKHEDSGDAMSDDMKVIKDHVEKLPSVARIWDLTNGGIKFIYNEEYVVEIYENLEEA